jgi:hypothetical protein
VPREITHRLVAEQTAAALAVTPFAAWAARRPACVALGAVFHDALYYAGGDLLARYRWVADRLHGEDGADTFPSVRSLVHALRGDDGPRDRARPERASLGAFLVGHVAHIQADATFHPFVYYHSGVPGPGGRMASATAQGHRRLETLIDLWVLGGPGRITAPSLGDDLALAGGCVRALARVTLEPLAADAPPGRAASSEELAQVATRALRRFARAEALFRSPLLSGLLETAWPVLPASVREIAALGYAPQLRRLLGRLDGRIAYRHPVTGAAHETTIDGLVEEAATRAAALCQRLALVIDGDTAAEAWLAGATGPALSAGLPGVPASALTLVAERPLVPV